MIITSSVVFLPCIDIQKTYDFYHNILHLPAAQKQSDKLFIFDTGYGYWGFCEYADHRAPLSGDHGVCLSLNMQSEADVDAAYEELKNKCVIHRLPVSHPSFPVYSLFVKDPDGYLVEFQYIKDSSQNLKSFPMEI